ncbi:MAG: MxaS protein [Methylicorpusculum sp.]|uniref:DUF58 domain-containing protein n=1 Tax=Methylicorpusculum sp. TaxID=2713644 RepID=UPI00271A05C9|nr:MxaS protein [Methylicorpusculum sp.]MDO8937826.1 MxaS protein [Methylicorpusculum sp.]MDP2202587.1 MxaS protein [Methylicorpusculum sp.]
MFSTTPFIYRLGQPSTPIYPGAHPGRLTGAGQLFKTHVPLMANPDTRRIDLRASLLNPFQSYRVKVFQQHSQTTLYVIADLSGSMGMQGQSSLMRVMSEFMLSAALSAYQVGDRFGFIGCDADVSGKWHIPAGHHWGIVQKMAGQLAELTPVGSSSGLLKTPALIASQHALIFLISDFHFDLTLLKALLPQLNRHTVVPVVLWNETSYLDLPEWGIVKFKDKENGATRTLLMRPAYKKQIIEAYVQRKADLQQCFRSLGTEPLFINQGYQSEEVTRYFQARAL